MIYVNQVIGWLAVLGLIIMGYGVIEILWPQDILLTVFTIILYIIVATQWISDNLQQIIDWRRRDE